MLNLRSLELDACPFGADIADAAECREASETPAILNRFSERFTCNGSTSCRCFVEQTGPNRGGTLVFAEATPGVALHSNSWYAHTVCRKC